MPILGFGVFQIPPEQTEQAVTRRPRPVTATSTRRPRTATRRPGAARSRHAGSLAELFVTTKMWITTAARTERSAPSRRRASSASTTSTCYLIHQPLGDDYSSGRARGLLRRWKGQGDRGHQLLPRPAGGLIDHNVVTPAVNQIEIHPFFQRQADQALERERGVQIQSWGPFAEGRNDLFATRSSATSARCTASRSPRSCCAGTSSAARR